MSEKEKDWPDVVGDENSNELDTQDDLHKLPENGSQERAMAEQRLVRKLDTRLLPTIFLIFILNYIDRNGVTTARLKGMQQDLHISDIQYATVIAILFVSYCPAQIPSNMILNKVSRPSLYIGCCAVLWGLTSALTGITKDFGGIIACRLFIGLPEAAFYPGAIFLLSRWYTKKELAFRSAFLYAGLLTANAFGGGTITIFFGFTSMWLLPDYVRFLPSQLRLRVSIRSNKNILQPNNTRWLSQSERRLAQARLSEDAGEADKDNSEDSQLQGLILAVKDPKVAIFAFMCISQVLGMSFVQFFPTLTETLGFNTTITLLLTAPPWIVSAVICCLNALHADKTGERFFHIMGWAWTVILGFIIAISTMSTAGRYVSLFLMSSGFVGLAMTLVWVSNAIPRPPAKRAAAIGIVNGFGNIGNIMGSYAWKASWGPEYHQSIAICLSALVASTLFALVIRQMLVRENRKLDADERAAMEGANRARVEEAARLEGITFEQAMERRKGYRYLY
ncbi:hypothetical protein M413DRAFT_24628 [Hebeloma cylindrosporum]|uniref:Major facilitator superfamily (MFS) profile domain-containing protein n=1 Tax=Hebeloma cylindrosporum TaxID=76867 RepID=A0A0C3CMS3_HEBCY|nr:hypothetical protein M413DRAFT_24628 [Hebeloma cylindrosporum h7]